MVRIDKPIWLAATLLAIAVVLFPATASAEQVADSQLQDSATSFHRALPDATKLDIYAGVFRSAGWIVDSVWGSPTQWAELCDSEPEGPVNTLSVDPTIRSHSLISTFEERYPARGLEALLEQNLIHSVCESQSDQWCSDSTATLTARLSTIRRGEKDEVEVSLGLYRKRPGCPGDERMGGFFASFRIVLELLDGAWVVTNTRLLRIT